MTMNQRTSSRNRRTNNEGQRPFNNPITILNNHSQKLNYSVNYEIQKHGPYSYSSFCSISVQGYGKSEKESKFNAARTMLSIYQNYQEERLRKMQSEREKLLQQMSAIQQASNDFFISRQQRLESLKKDHQNKLEDLIEKHKKIVLEVEIKSDLLERQDKYFKSLFNEDFENVECIGYGGFAVVFKGTYKMDDKQYAIKRIPLRQCQEAKKKIMKEVKSLMTLTGHQSIVRFVTFWWEAPPKNWQMNMDKQFYSHDSSRPPPSWTEQPDWRTPQPSQNYSQSDEGINTIYSYGCCSNEKEFCSKRPPLYFYIQMELCGGTLRHWLESRNRVVKPVSYKIFIQIVEAVAFIHQERFIHRDLKPGNIFLDKSNDGKLAIGTVKVGDFGLATETTRIMDSENNKPNSRYLQIHTELVGTELYRAPEQERGGDYNHKVDIYALGIIFFELFYRFGTESERREKLHNLRKGIFPDELNEHETNFLKFLLSENPKDRPEASQINGSKQFKDFVDKGMEKPQRTKRSKNINGTGINVRK